jgi:hypothetical protein
MATTGKNGGSKIFWIIGGLVVIAGGVGAYFLLRKPKEETGSEETNTDSDNNSDLGLGLSSASATYTAPAELNTTDKIKAFQDWMDAQGKGWVLVNGKYKLLNKGAGYGTYGKNTDAVWKVYGVAYLKSLKTPSATTKPVSSLNTDSPSDISTIINFSTGTKAEKSSLSKANADFVSTWAKAIKDKKSAFIWANQVYRTKTGDKILDSNPINVNYYTKVSGRIAKTSPDDSASAYLVGKGTNLGKVTALDYNNGLWLYAPNSGNVYKWYKIDTITTKKPSSSFEGFTDEVEFASFDSNFDLNL